MSAPFDITDCFQYRGSGYRATCFYRRERVEYSADDLAMFGLMEITPREFQYVRCGREQAEFVAGCGVCGCLARVEDVTYDGPVAWTAEQVAVEKARVAAHHGRAYEDPRVFDKFN